MKAPLAVTIWMAAASCGAQQMEFDYTSVMGPSDIEIRLSIRGGEATLIRQPEAPKEGAVIGVFRAPADAGFLSWLEKGFPEAIPAASAVQPDMPTLETARTWKGRTVRWAAPVPSAASEALAPLTAAVRKEAARLDAAPYRAVFVESRGFAAGGTTTWKVRLRNPGSRPVEIDWSENPVRVLGLQGETLEDVTAGAVEADPSATTIPPRGFVDVSVPVRFPNPGEWRVRAVYQVSAGTQPESGPVGGATSSKSVPVAVR